MVCTKDEIFMNMFNINDGDTNTCTAHYSQPFFLTDLYNKLSHDKTAI